MSNLSDAAVSEITLWDFARACDSMKTRMSRLNYRIPNGYDARFRRYTWAGDFECIETVWELDANISRTFGITRTGILEIQRQRRRLRLTGIEHKLEWHEACSGDILALPARERLALVEAINRFADIDDGRYE